MFIGGRQSTRASLGVVLVNLDNNPQVQQSQLQMDIVTGLRTLRGEGMNYPPGN